MNSSIASIDVTRALRNDGIEVTALHNGSCYPKCAISRLCYQLSDDAARLARFVPHSIKRVRNAGKNIEM